MSKLFSKGRTQKVLLGGGLLLAALSLVMWSEQSAQAAKDGLQLCFNVIIPALFPFFVLSSLVVELGFAGYIGRALERIMRPMFRVPGGCASALALGLIGGYPVGAQTAAALYEKGMCSKAEAERLLAFCNNCGPAFIVGVVGTGIFSSSRVGILLYLVHVVAAVCVGILFRFCKRQEKDLPVALRMPVRVRRLSTAFTDSIKNSFFSMLNICAFVVFFTVLIRMLIISGVFQGVTRGIDLLLPNGMGEQWGERLLIGLLEVSSGVCSLSGEGSFAGRLVMAAFILGWGGLSVHCQALSFVGASGLSMGNYWLGKLLHGGLSALLVAILVKIIPMGEQVSADLQQWLEGIASMGFNGTVVASVAAAGSLFLVFFAVAVRLARKNGGKGRQHVV